MNDDRPEGDAVDPEVAAALRLREVSGLGPKRLAALVRHFGSARRVMQASPQQLLQIPGLPGDLARTIVAQAPTVEIGPELELIHRHGVKLVPFSSPEYPALLKEIPDPPALLYLLGEFRPGDEHGVALVGSRHPSAYGKRMAARLAADLARRGYVVISGLARGIDSIAHRAALDAGGRTLAVLAGGLAKIYPPEHRDLAVEVSRQGVVLTESAMSQESLPGLFPVRNRLISGLSRAVVIVEAAAQSGALITAEHASDQGRTVLAVPGLADASEGAGCNALIREGAVLCRGVEDILEELQGYSAALRRPAEPVPTSTPAPAPARTAAPTSGPPAGLDEGQRALWTFLSEPRHLDEIVQNLALSVSSASMMLLTLEMKRIVRRLPGSRYERC